MKKSILLMMICCLFSQLIMAQAPKWLDKTKKAVFSIITYDKDNNILSTGNGFFVTADGVAVSDYTLFKGAQKAVAINSDGKQMEINSILGANSLYDVVKFRVAIDKPVTALSIAPNPVAVGEEVYLLPYSTQKEKLFRAGTVKEIGKVRETHQYYTLNLSLGEKQVSCPITNKAGQVVGIVQKESGDNAATICYAVGITLPMELAINPLSMTDLDLNTIGIKKGLPDTEDQALVYLFMASSQSTPEEYQTLLNDFISLYPNSADGYIRRASNYVYNSDGKTSEIEKAVADLSRALDVASKKDDVHFNVAKLIYNYSLSKKEGEGYKDWNLDKALDEIKKARAINPLAVYMQMEGDILFAKQDFAGALACYEEAARNDLASPSVFYSAAKAKQLLNADLKEVIVLMDSCIARCPQPMSRENASYLLERAQMYMDTEQYRAAMLDYDEYHKAVGGDVNDVFYYYREQAAFHAKQFQKALDDIQLAIRLAPGNVTYRAELAVINVRVGRYEEAEKVLKDAIAIEPEYAEAYRLLAIAQVQLKKNKEACENFAKAKELGDPAADELIVKYCK